jgi:hypothetical protein
MVLGLSPYASVALYYLILIAGAVWLWRRLPAVSEGPVLTSVSKDERASA